MAGLDPAIQFLRKKMDPRVKPGGDVLLVVRSRQSFDQPTGSSNLKPMVCNPSSAFLPYSASISLPRLGA